MELMVAKSQRKLSLLTEHATRKIKRKLWNDSLLQKMNYKNLRQQYLNNNFVIKILQYDT